MRICPLICTFVHVPEKDSSVNGNIFATKRDWEAFVSLKIQNGVGFDMSLESDTKPS